MSLPFHGWLDRPWPRRQDQTVEFEAADERKLNELLGEPERTEPRKFNAIKVPF